MACGSDADAVRKLGRPADQILRVVQHVVDDLALHHDPEERFHIGVAMSRPDVLFEALAVQRDRGNRRKRQPRDRLAVRTNFVETPMIAAD